MPNNPFAIRLENIGKCYRIYSNPQDRFKQALRDRFGSLFGKQNSSALYREHWALRDVSFEVAPGEAVGILGKNGAGKSTLLQVIAGTLAPTTGQVETSGRITALLELGSGFNPEFTGRENVYHNAQILGMSREEASSRFDDIASFADIGDFIDQPVKTYSSGMMMRLAFAVQTVLDPKILIVDEALSVGDARFQEKCFRKLRHLLDNGTCLLFVTHDVNSVTTFCDRGILIDAGAVLSIDRPAVIAKEYLEVLYSDPDKNKCDKSVNQMSNVFFSGVVAEVDNNVLRTRPENKQSQDYGRFGNKKVEIISLGVFNMDGAVASVLVSGEKYRFVQRVYVNEDVDYLSTGIVIRTPKSVDVFGTTNITCGQSPFLNLKQGEILEVAIEITLWLAAGDYILQAANAGHDGIQYDCILSALQLTVIGTPNLFTTSVVNLCPQFQLKFTK